VTSLKVLVISWLLRAIARERQCGHRFKILMFKSFLDEAKGSPGMKCIRQAHLYPARWPTERI